MEFKPQEMLRLIDGISRERNLDKELLFVDLEQAMVSAARKHFGAEDIEEFSCEIDRMTGQIALWRGDEAVSLESLGRIPAQTAKQVMIQRFREDERNAVYNDFADRVGEVVAGQVLRYEGRTMVIALSRGMGAQAEAYMPWREQIPGEHPQSGDRVRCLLSEVREDASSVKVIVSRSKPEFVRKLFEVEVPEIADRVVEIKAMSREAGKRAKVAVYSIDSKVDAVGACVGVRGSRIRNVVDELGGEKIDIVRWSDSSQLFISNALKPAEIAEISLCFDLGRATVVVAEDQLSLAIGKHGQNVRLAARLTGWDVDILTPVEYTRNLDALEQAVRSVEGSPEDLVDQVAALGIVSVLDVEELGPEFLEERLSLDENLSVRIATACAECGARLEEEQRQRKEEEALQRKQQDVAADQGIDDLLGGGASSEGDATPSDTTPSDTPSDTASDVASDVEE